MSKFESTDKGNDQKSVDNVAQQLNNLSVQDNQPKQNTRNYRPKDDKTATNGSHSEDDIDKRKKPPRERRPTQQQEEEDDSVPLSPESQEQRAKRAVRSIFM
jgi:hypothetical protein